MLRFFIGLIIGFMIGMPYGVFQVVEVPDSVIVKVAAMIKGVIGVIGK